MARIKKAKILERKLFIRRLEPLDVKNTFPIQGTAWDQVRLVRRIRSPGRSRLVNVRANCLQFSDPYCCQVALDTRRGKKAGVSYNRSKPLLLGLTMNWPILLKPCRWESEAQSVQS